MLLGATAYYISFKIHSPKRRRVPASRRDVIDQQAIESDEDEFFTEFHRKRSQREQDNFAPVIFTFEDLFERAVLLADRRSQQRKVKLLFDSNDEYVLEDAVPELLSYRQKCF